MASFSGLPVELRDAIYTFCSKKDLLHLSSCSKMINDEVKPKLWSRISVTWNSLCSVSSVITDNLQYTKSLKITNHRVKNFNLTVDISTNFRAIINGSDSIVSAGFQTISERFPSLIHLFLNLDSLPCSTTFQNWSVLSFLRLKVLRLSLVKIVDDDLKGLNNLSKLEDLSILPIDCVELTSLFLEHVSQVSGLTSFTYHGYVSDRISDSDYAAHLPKLRNLTDLDLSNISVGVEFCSKASDLFKNMVSLRLGYTDVEEQCLDHISASAHNLTKLDLQMCPLTDEALRRVSKLTKLEHLWLRGVEITDLGIYHISSLPCLLSLDVASCDLLTDLSLEYIGNLTSLKKIDISCTGFTDAGLMYLSKLKGLLEIAYDVIDVIESLLTEEGRKKAGLPEFVRDLEVYDL